MGKYTHLTEKDRVEIFNGLKKGKSKAKIAKEIRKSRSAVGREIRRNSSPELNGEYLPDTAQKKAQKRKHIQQPKLSKNEALKAKVIDCLMRGWSPEVIAGRLQLEYGISVCTETIYTFIYSIEGRAQNLYQYLVKKKKTWNTTWKKAQETENP